MNCSKQCDINNIKNKLKELVKDIKENKLDYPNSKYVTTDNLSQYIEKCTILDTKMHDMVFAASIGCNFNWQEDVLREVIKIGFVLRKIRNINNINNTNNMNAQLQLHDIITFTDNDVYNFVTKDFNINEIVKNYSIEYIIRNVDMLDIVLHKILRKKAQKQKTKHEYWNAYDVKNYLIDVCLPELKRFCNKVQTHGLYNISINKYNDQDNNKYNRKVSHVANNYNISIYKKDVKKIPYTENTVYNNIINVVATEHYHLPIIALHELLHVEYQINEAKGIYYVNDFRIICRKICDKLMSNAIMHNLNKFNYESMYSDILNALMLFDNAEELATITGLRVDNNGKLLVLPCENMALLRESGSIRLSHIAAIIPGSRLFYEFLITDCYNCKNQIYKRAVKSKKFEFFETIYNIYNNILPFLNHSSKKELIKRIVNKTDIKHAIKLLNSKQNTKTIEKTKKLASKIAKMPDIVRLNRDIAKTMLALQKADNSVIEQLVHMEIFLQKYCNRYDFCTILKRYVNTKMSDDELINKTIEILVQYYNAQEFSRTDIEDFQKYEGEVSFDMLYLCLDTFINKYHYPKNTKEYMATAIREFLEEIDAQNKLV